jgi:type I restriction enzyme S subunit
MEKREGYKETKIGWIPEDWDVVRLGKITDKVGSGITPRGGSKVYLDEGIPFFRSQNILHGKISTKDIVYISEIQHQKMKNTHLQPDDVLLNITGASIGRCCVFPRYFEKGNVNQHVCIIRPDGIINSQYLCCILNSPIGQQQIWNFQAGGNREGLNFQQIKSFNIPLVPLPEQKKIAELLTTVDDKISSIEDQIRQTEQLKKGLMEKLLTEGIGHTEFKDTKVGKIPKSWGVVKLIECCEAIQDGTHFSPKSKNGPFKYLTSKNIKFGTIDLTNILHISTEDHNSIYSRCPVQFGDVLLTKDGANTGNVAINTLEEPFSLLSSVAFIRSNSNFSTNSFILQYLLSPNGQKIIKNSMT